MIIDFSAALEKVQSMNIFHVLAELKVDAEKIKTDVESNTSRLAEAEAVITDMGVLLHDAGPIILPLLAAKGVTIPASILALMGTVPAPVVAVVEPVVTPKVEETVPVVPMPEPVPPVTVPDPVVTTPEPEKTPEAPAGN